MVRMVSLSEEAYAVLKKLKEKNLSFSDVIMKYLAREEAKTEDKSDLIEWLKNLPKPKKKVNISENIDKIAYGV